MNDSERKIPPQESRRWDLSPSSCSGLHSVLSHTHKHRHHTQTHSPSSFLVKYRYAMGSLLNFHFFGGVFLFSSFIYIFTHLFTSHPICHPPFSPPCPTLTTPLLPPLLFREGGSPHGYHSTLVHQVAAGLSVSSPTEVSQSSPARGRRSISRQWSQHILFLIFLIYL